MQSRARAPIDKKHIIMGGVGCTLCVCCCRWGVPRPLCLYGRRMLLCSMFCVFLSVRSAVVPPLVSGEVCRVWKSVMRCG